MEPEPGGIGGIGRGWFFPECHMKVRWMLGALCAVSALGVNTSWVCAQYRAGGPASPQNPQQPQSQTPSNSLAAPRKAVQDAQAAVNDDRAKIAQIRARVATAFESKEDWIAAKKAVVDAQAHYEAAMKPLMAALQANPDYQKLVANRKAAQLKLDALKAQSKATDSESQKEQDAELSEAAGEVLTSGYAMNKMEADAKEGDGNLGMAKEELLDSKKAMDALQAQVTAVLQVDPEYIAEQQNLTTAQQQLTAAKAALAAAEKPQRTAQPPRSRQSPAKTTAAN